MSLRGIGDNGGPPLVDEPPDDGASWRLWCWKRARKRAWKTPPREIALRRLANAEKAGVSYREYTLEILERGVYLPPASPVTAPALPAPRHRNRRSCAPEAPRRLLA
jgi:hypothetical protein